MGCPSRDFSPGSAQGPSLGRMLGFGLLSLLHEDSEIESITFIQKKAVVLLVCHTTGGLRSEVWTLFSP